MKTGLRGRLRFTDGLGFRLVLLLSLALLPLGLIAVAQSWRVVGEAQRASEAALLGRTSEAAASERALIQTAVGSAEGLGQYLAEVGDDLEICRDLMRNFVWRSGVIIYAAFVQADGLQRCASRGEEMDVSDFPGFQRMQQERKLHVGAMDSGVVTGIPVIIIRSPVFRDGTYLGYVTLSMPESTLRAVRRYSGQDDRAEIITFNVFGDVLIAEPGVEQRLPRDHPIETLADDSEKTFQGVTTGGQARIFAVVPVIPGQVYALGSWRPDTGFANGSSGIYMGLLFPVLMWLASLTVAYFAVHRLVIRHIREMRGQMRRFALGQRNEPPEVLHDAPAEIQDVSQTFHNLARILIRDEAELEASLAEKTVLLKEVHHRVKNNLQLIASIMNMQIRKVQEPSARSVLRSVQDRVMSLSAIHRSLYQAERLTAVRADTLLNDIVNQMLMLGADPENSIAVTAEFASVPLYPDQAVPLALLATEAVTNAMKYIGRPESGRPWLTVRLSQPAEGEVLFEVANSCGTPLQPQNEGQMPSTGLGMQLIEAFVTQLEAELEAGMSDGSSYRLAVRFRIADFLPE